MELLHKNDFERVVERFEAWWDRQIIDRPPITLPNVRSHQAPQSPEKIHPSQRERWMDVEFAIDRFEASLESRAFLADTVPMFLPNLGPELTATLFGAELEFDERTSWSSPVVGSPREILDIKPNFDNVYWTTIRKLTEVSLQRGRGKWLTGITDLHTNGDLVAALRDPQSLCLDMADDLESVRAACEYVTDFFPQIYEDLYDRIAREGQPATSWLPALHAGKMYITNCDFICMISPEMFARTILPCLVREMRYLDRNIFHLDGPAALTHLDTLLGLEEMDGVQWVYGAGNEPTTKWIDVYRKIQRAGKCIYVGCQTFEEAIEMTEHLRPEGVWFRILGEYAPDEAEQFIRRIERWAARKRA